MKLTAELSLYPLHEGYIEAIESFIQAARKAGEECKDMIILTNAMSTQICGEWDEVMALISTQLKASHKKFGRQVLVCKLIPGELALA